MTHTNEWEKEFDKFYIGGGLGNICKTDPKDTRVVGLEGIKDFIRSLLLSQKQQLLGEISKKMQPAFDDFTKAAQTMIKSEVLKRTGTEILENVGYMKSILLDSLNEEGKKRNL